MRTAGSTANGRTGGIGPDQHAIYPLQTGRIRGHHRSNGRAGGGLTACGGGGSDDTIRALVATDQTLGTAFNTPVVVNLLANATSPNVGGVLALVGTPTVSNGTFSLVGNTITVTPTTGFVGNMVVRYVVGDGKADNANGTVTITVRAAADVAAPTITLKGSSPLTLTQGDTYTELGATWADASDGTGTDTTITGSVNTAVIGIYTITYSKTNAAGNVGTATRTVLVVARAPAADTTAPVIALTGAASISLTVGGSYTELGATWTDAVDGSGTVTDITGSVNTAAVGSYTLTYRKTDAAGNTGTATRTVTVTAAPDTTAPVVTLNGAASVSLTVGNTYTELGATWTDAVDGSGAVSDITGTVNTAAVGSYTRIYRKTDAAGNIGVATRTVTVNAAPDPMPTGAALANVSTGDNGGGGPIAPINAGGATDPLGRVITYSMSSVFLRTECGVPPGSPGYIATAPALPLVINSSTGVISGTFDANCNSLYTVTVTATPAGGSNPLVRTFTLTIIDQG